MKYVELRDWDNKDTVWLVWAEGHVDAFRRAKARGVKGFSSAMNFDPSRGPLFE